MKLIRPIGRLLRSSDHPSTGSKRQVVLGYAIALAAPNIALWCALALSRPGASNPLAIPMFLAAVACSAWWGGWGPGLVATLLGFLATDYFFEDPVYSLDISSISTAFDLLIFVATSILIGTLSTWLKTGRPAQPGNPGLPARENSVRGLSKSADTPRPESAELHRVSPVDPPAWDQSADMSTAVRAPLWRASVLPDESMGRALVERTLVIVKPDGVERALVGDILNRFEQRGLRLCAMKMMQPHRALIEQHYAHHRSQPFFYDVVQYMMGGPVVAMILEGTDAIRVVRALVGSPHPDQAKGGTIRGDFGVSRLQTLVHSADSHTAVAREIGLWFSPDEDDVTCVTSLPPSALAS
ncbi:MAG: hypothetical protein NVSMB2_07750 [Chloroflexota bacterium]